MIVLPHEWRLYAQLIQAKFHTFLINHYIIKQEVTITLRVQELVIADLLLVISGGYLQMVTVMTPLLTQVHFITGQGNTEALSAASIKNVFRHRKFIFPHRVLKSLGFTWNMQP